MASIQMGGGVTRISNRVTIEQILRPSNATIELSLQWQS